MQYTQHTQIEVIVSGAVKRGGRARLHANATIDAALQAAGGLAPGGYRSAGGGLVLRRRRASSRRVEVHRWNIFDEHSRGWRSFPLADRDVLIFDWSLRGDR